MHTNDTIVKAVQKIEERKGSKVFLFLLNSDTSITEESFQEALKQFKRRTKFETLEVIIQSYGGSIDAAYKLVKLFRKNAGKYKAWVLDYAKSAATFICLGADEIILMPHSELGPLDAQVRDPRDSTGAATISALDAFKSLQYLRTIALENFDFFTKLLLHKAPLKITDTLDYSIKFTSGIMSPLYQQVDPLDLGEYGRILEIGKEYGERIFSKNPVFSKDKNKLDSVLDKLIWGYPSHTFVIDYDELKEMGFRVSLASEEELELLQEMGENLDGKTCIGFLSEGKKEKDKNEQEKNRKKL